MIRESGEGRDHSESSTSRQPLQQSSPNTDVCTLFRYAISFIFCTANFPPKIHGPSVIQAVINQAVEVNITADHNSSNSFVFTVTNFPNVEIVANTSQFLVIRWQPTSSQRVCFHTIYHDLIIIIIIIVITM